MNDKRVKPMPCDECGVDTEKLLAERDALKAENARLTDQNAALQVEIAKAVEVPVQERLDAAEAEVERCHRELKRLQADNARLAADNAHLAAALHKIASVTGMIDWVDAKKIANSAWMGSSTALRDRLAPTIELLECAKRPLDAEHFPRWNAKLTKEIARLESLVKGDKP